MTKRDRSELDYHITKRFLDFYDGLIERGQIKPPAPLGPMPEDSDDDVSRYTSSSAPAKDRIQSGGDS